MEYAGEMILPRNCVAMTEDEMTYVDGGISKAQELFAKGINWVSGIILGGMVYSAIVAHIGTIINAFHSIYVAAMVALGSGAICPVMIAAAGAIILGGGIAIRNYGRQKKWW